MEVPRTPIPPALTSRVPVQSRAETVPGTTVEGTAVPKVSRAAERIPARDSTGGPDVLCPVP